MYTKGESGWVIEYYTVAKPGRVVPDQSSVWVPNPIGVGSVFTKHTWPQGADMALAAYYDADADTFEILDIAFFPYVSSDLEVKMVLAGMDNPILAPLWRKLAAVQGWSLGQGEQGTNEGNKRD